MSQQLTSSQIKKRNKANTKFIHDLKEATPCKDCGKKFPHYVMEFDHVRGQKRFGISFGCRNYSLDVIRTEMKKCELVCANCHRERTFSRERDSRTNIKEK